ARPVVADEAAAEASDDAFQSAGGGVNRITSFLIVPLTPARACRVGHADRRCRRRRTDWMPRGDSAPPAAHAGGSAARGALPELAQRQLAPRPHLGAQVHGPQRLCVVPAETGILVLHRDDTVVGLLGPREVDQVDVLVAGRDRL